MGGIGTIVGILFFVMVAFAALTSSVSVMDFLKRSSVGYASREGFMRIRDHASRFARVEGFDAHALAVEERSTKE